MKREILFRGKRVDNGEWVYGDLYQEKHPFKNELKQVMIVEYRPDLCLVSGANDSNHYWREVHPETVCQFTGLLDKNGNKIFEWDIVDAWSQGSHVTGGIIKWGIGTCRFFISDESNSIVCNLSGGGKQYQQETIEITGNIHDK